MDKQDINIEVVSIDDLVQDDHNFNRGTEEGAQLIERSFREHGAGRSVFIDRDNRLVGGNKAQKGFKAAGKKKVIIVDSDADTLVAVRRKDVSLDTAEGRQMAYLDNLTTQVNLSWDQTELEAVQADVEGFDISDFGYEIDSLPQVQMPTPADETEDEAIERKRREFEEKMKNGELDEDDPEYQEFLKKFEAKKTTDDCYTPELIYEAVANWVASEYNVSRANFVRPFYPGGDYQKEQYKPTDIVVDNPPFSIMAEILNFYKERGIRFFLFGPHLTLFSSSSSSSCTALPIGVSVTYANGANINTSFLTNLEDPRVRFRSCPTLYQAVKKANDEWRKSLSPELPVYSYDKHMFNVTLMCQLSRLGIEIVVPVAESEVVSQLDAQKEMGKAIFGKGYLVSDRLYNERLEAEELIPERERQERERQEREKEKKAKANVFQLSDRERGIIERLNQQAEKTPRQ